jgi:hypothetical protein
MDEVKLVGDEAVSLVILTDGQENASKEHTKESIRALLDARQKERNWLVLYLGANQDAFAESGKIGIEPAMSLAYAAGNEVAAVQSSARSVRVFAEKRSRTAAAFTPAERTAAMQAPRKT